MSSLLGNNFQIYSKSLVFLFFFPSLLVCFSSHSSLVLPQYICYNFVSSLHLSLLGPCSSTFCLHETPLSWSLPAHSMLHCLWECVLWNAVHTPVHFLADNIVLWNGVNRRLSSLLDTRKFFVMSTNVHVMGWGLFIYVYNWTRWPNVNVFLSTSVLYLIRWNGIFSLSSLCKYKWIWIHSVLHSIIMR